MGVPGLEYESLMTYAEGKGVAIGLQVSPTTKDAGEQVPALYRDWTALTASMEGKVFQKVLIENGDIEKAARQLKSLL